MLELEELRRQLLPYKGKISEMETSLCIADAILKVTDFETQLTNPDIWSDNEKSQTILKELKPLQNKINSFNSFTNNFDDILTLIEMAIEEDDDSLYDECKTSFKDFENSFESFRLATLLQGEFDSNNAILTLHAGAGGTEACDWVSMLFRMYTRFAEKMKYKVEILDYLDGDEAGIKSVTMQISGLNAFGYLKSEKGVHRLVRISPFDSSGRRHTSFASCDIMPEIDDDVEIEIRDEDLSIDTYRASGAGGQHVNTTDSAVRITHIPSGIIVQCQNERSQHKNRDRALKMLRAKLFEKQEQERLEKLQGIRGETKEIGWGSQIRSYTFHPYNLVKDHRTNEQIGNTDSVMDGNLMSFINAYLAWILNQENESV